LRWKAPQPVDDSDGVFDAYYNGKYPIQTEWPSDQASYYAQGEDCLYLNIWLNETDKTADKPVMVFFHGGSYGWGGTADPIYDGANFVGKQSDIILVTVGYRVGMMGFVDFSSVKGGEDFPDSPNLGLLDQIEALRWVQKNIGAFGGNPENVTVFGESAGGGSVSLLPIIPQAKGLFKRVIAESGSVALTFSKEQCQNVTEKLLKAAGTESMQDLMALTEAELKLVNESVNDINNFPQRDGKLIPLDPYLPYENGESAGVDIMIGTNSDEMNYWIGEIGGMMLYRFTSSVKFENDLKSLSYVGKRRVKKFIDSLEGPNIWRVSEFYNEMMFRLPAIYQAQEHSKNGGKAYMYYWTVPSAIPDRKACHAVELAYVFGNLEETIYTGERADEDISDAVMQMWTNFARTGNPSTDEIEWKPYDVNDRASLVISDKPHMSNDVLHKQRKMLSPLLKRMINPSYAELDYNVPYVRKLLAGGLLAVSGVAAAAVLTAKLFKD
jgi:para-nitrobenzyl esterase